MKKYLGLLTAIAISFTISTQAQRPRGGMGGPPTPDFGGAMSKYFGDNSNFTANMEMQTKDMQGTDMTMPGKIAFAENKVRFEMNMGDMKSGGKPSPAAAQIKQMGMDQMIIISRPDKKVSDMIYPGMKAYVEMPIETASTNNAKEDYKLETTELGKETIDGHACIKNKAVVTDKDGNKNEAILWNATDLKKFPIKIEQIEQGQHATMLFKNVEFTKPKAELFDVPSGLNKYDSMQQMMQEIMMKKFGDAQRRPAAPPAPGQP
jgi:hypothetical protein